MNDQSVSLAAIGLAVTAVGGIVWLAKYFAQQLSKDLREHTKAATQLTDAAKEQTSASKEVLTFMKKLNGKLDSATIQKAAEQQIKAQENL